MPVPEVISILGLGFVLGLKHATDADHLIAVSTIVSERKGIWSSSIVGLLWGLGHSASLFVVALAVVAFEIRVPENVAVWMELAVAAMLVILGANVLWKVRQGATLHAHEHRHNEKRHVHVHMHAPGKETVHDHAPRVGKRPFFVGMLHGMAGSAALMLVVLATISSRPLALLYIALFGAGSIGGMIVMSALIGLPFAFTARHQRLSTTIRASAGALSVCFGLFYAWDIGRLVHW
jgi:ABC-type nickel/cobalt efflux system permease component RcnA